MPGFWGQWTVSWAKGNWQNHGGDIPRGRVCPLAGGTLGSGAAGPSCFPQPPPMLPAGAQAEWGGTRSLRPSLAWHRDPQMASSFAVGGVCLSGCLCTQPSFHGVKSKPPPPTPRVPCSACFCGTLSSSPPSPSWDPLSPQTPPESHTRINPQRPVMPGPFLTPVWG